MKSKVFISSSILRKFLVFNLIVFLVLGIFTFLYLNAIKPNLVKNRSKQHLKVIENTSNHFNRLNVQFKERTVKKIYWAIVTKHPKINYGKLEHWLIKNQKQNKSYAYDSELTNSKKSILEFKTLKKLENYNLIEIKLDTGRHHQIRAQLSKINIIIKGDVKYGSKRPNNDGSIDLHSRKLSFSHPIDGTKLDFKSRLPKRHPWNSVLCD